jgi:hypothetical protein
MKKLILGLLLILGVNNLYADQLAYISKKDANRAVELITKAKKVIDYCGCCTGISPLKVKVTGVEARFTDYEEYYEVYITYKDENKAFKTVPVDLAYLWVKIKGEVQTVGKVLGLEHDSCVKSGTISWKV